MRREARARPIVPTLAAFLPQPASAAEVAVLTKAHRVVYRPALFGAHGNDVALLAALIAAERVPVVAARWQGRRPLRRGVRKPVSGRVRDELLAGQVRDEPYVLVQECGQ